MPNINLYITNIVWEAPRRTRLPKNVLFVMSQEQYDKDKKENEDVLSDVLSDQFGFCIESLDDPIQLTIEDFQKLTKRVKEKVRQSPVIKMEGYMATVGKQPFQECAQFLLCTNIATTTLPHPLLGDVPTCERCKTKMDNIAKR